jgi:hypothetical protein
MRRALRYAFAVCAVLALIPERASAQVGAPLVGLQDGVTANFLHLEWTGTEEDQGHLAELLALDGFSVLGSLSPGGPVIGSLQLPVSPPELEETFVPKAVIPGLPNGTFWIIAVKGHTNATTAPASAWLQVVVNVSTCGSAPLAPTSLQNLPTPGTPVALSWTSGPGIEPGGGDSGGCPAKHFLVAAGTAPGLSNIAVLEISGAVTILQGTAPAGTYFVRVHARNDFGVSGPSNEVQITVAGCAGPGPPQNLAVSVVGNKQLQLTWSPPAANVSNLTGYRLIGRIVDGNPLLGGIVDVGPVTSLLSGPVAPSTYEIQVYAISVCEGSAPQLSAPSLPVSVVVP